MKLVLKSYLKAYFKNWIEAIGLIIFVIIIIMTVSGVLSGAIQFQNHYNELLKDSGKWDYYFLNKGSYQPGLIKNYYLNGHDNEGNKVLGDGTPLLNKDSDWWRNVSKKCARKTAPEAINYCESNAILTKVDTIIRHPHDFDKQAINEDVVPKLAKYDYSAATEFAHWLLEKNNDNSYSVSYNNGIYLTPIKNRNMQYFFSPLEPIKYKDYKNIDEPDKLKIYEGRRPQKENEIVLNVTYAKLNNYKVGDTLNIKLEDGRVLPEYHIVGLGLDLDNLLKTSNTISNKNYAIIYMLNSDLSALRDQTYDLKDWTRAVSVAIYIKLGKDIEQANKILKENILRGFTNWLDPLQSYRDSPNASSLENVQIQIILYSVIGAVLLFLGFIFINYVMKKEMNKTRKQIGIFKAMGYKNIELSWIFTSKFIVTILASVVIGYLLSLPIQMYVNQLYTTTFLLPIQLVYIPLSFGLILFLFIPVIFAIIAFFLNLLYLKQPILRLANGVAVTKIGFVKNSIKKLFSRTHYVFRMQLSFTLHSMGKWIAVMFIFFVSSFLFIVQFNSQDIFNNLVIKIGAGFNHKVDHVVKVPQWFLENITVSQQPSNLKVMKLLNDNKTSFVDINDENNREKITKNIKKFEDTILDNARKQSTSCIDSIIPFLQYKPFRQSILLTDLQEYANILFQKCSVPSTPSNASKSNPIDNIPGWLLNVFKSSYMVDNKDAFLTFNQFVYDSSKEVPFLSMRASSDRTQFIKQINVQAPKKEDYLNYFNVGSLTPEQINEVFNDDAIKQDSDDFPIINGFISYRYAKLANLHINDEVELTLGSDSALTGYKIKLVVKGIIKDEILSNSVYLDWNKMRQLFVDTQDKPIDDLYNAVISETKLVNQPINSDDLKTGNINIKFNVLDTPVTLQNLPNTNCNFMQINKGVDNGEIDVISLLSLDTKNIYAIDLIKNFAKSGMQMVNSSLLILQILNGISIFVILVVITSSVIDESSNIILMLRSLGYKPWQVNYIIIGNYVIGVIMFFLIAYAASIGMWYFVSQLVFNQFKFIVGIPWNWASPVKAGVIIGIVVIMSWLLSMYLVKKKKLNQVTE